MKYSKPRIKEQEILLKAIKLAIKNGWNPKYHFYEDKEEATGVEIGVSDVIWVSKDGYQVYEDMYHLLFNHDFAKALWGLKLIDHQEVDNDGLTWNFSTMAWQYHLQQLVIADDVFKYLEENI